MGVSIVPMEVMVVVMVIMVIVMVVMMSRVLIPLTDPAEIRERAK